MARTAKRLAQTALSTTGATIYTAPAGTTTQITEIYFANTGATTSRTLTLYVNGTATSNTIVAGLVVPGTGTQILSDAKIVIPANTIFAAKQDVGTDVICTIFGIEEA